MSDIEKLVEEIADRLKDLNLKPTCLYGDKEGYDLKLAPLDAKIRKVIIIKNYDDVLDLITQIAEEAEVSVILRYKGDGK